MPSDIDTKKMVKAFYLSISHFAEALDICVVYATLRAVLNSIYILQSILTERIYRFV